MKKFLLISAILLMIIIMASCNWSRTRETGFFRWQLHNEWAAIIGLTDEGKQQEFLVIPEIIEGKRVGFRAGGREIIMWLRTDSRGSMESENVRRLYLPPHLVTTRYNFFKNMPNLTHIFVINNSRRNLELIGAISNEIRNQKNTILFMRNDRWMTFPDVDSFDGITTPIGINPGFSFQARAANIEFIYNFDYAPNDGLFFLDDWQGSLIKFRPEDPIREGYRFAGWYWHRYGEDGPLSEWNFNEDKVSETIPGNFEITRLYAKWENI